MKIARNIIAALTALVTLVLAGCSTAATPTPAVTTQVAAVDNSTMESIRGCNRAAGSGVIITFDDFGEPAQAQAILAMLRQHNWRGAFFPTGEWALEHLDLINQMKAEGHIVGNHTQTHANLGKLLASGKQADLDKLYGEIYPLEGVANTSPMWLRPPYEGGAYTPELSKLLAEKNIQACTWTVDTYDWNGDSVDQMMKRMSKGDKYSPKPIGNDDVVLMHMFSTHAPGMIDALAVYLDANGIPRELIG